MGRSQSLRWASSWVGLDTTIHSASGCTTTLLRWGRLRTINGLAQVYNRRALVGTQRKSKAKERNRWGKKERKKEEKKRKPKKKLFLSARLVISDLVEAYTCESPNLKIIIILLSAVKAGRS